jgi:hypothetical protein
MKMTVLWDVSLCSLVEIERCFGCSYRLHHQGDNSLIALMMKAVRISETSDCFCQTARRNVPEDSHLRVVFSLR